MRQWSDLPRFFVEAEAIQEKFVTFSEPISRQILTVLRLDANQAKVIVLDNSGAAWLTELTGKSGKFVSGKLLEEIESGDDCRLELTLCFSLSKREKIELILQKCTEIGVTHFLPYFSERSLNRTESLDSKRLTRWQCIIREAAEQSERNKLPKLMNVMNFQQLISGLAPDTQKLCAYEASKSTYSFGQLTLKPGKVALLIGPEGGFSDFEIELVRLAGFQLFSLGKRILRMETACMVASALVVNRLEST